MAASSGNGSTAAQADGALNPFLAAEALANLDGALLDLLPVAVYVCDADGAPLRWNRRAVELWGREPKRNDPLDRYLGSFPLFSVGGSPIARGECWMAQALRQNKEGARQEIVVERPDGSRRRALAYASPFHDEAGNVVGAVNVLVDVTDENQAEVALRQRGAQLRLVADHAPALLAHCDREGRYKFVNKAYAARFGLRPQDVIGKRIAEVVGEEAYATFREYVEAALAGRSVEFEVEIPYERIGRHFMRCTYAPELDEHGQVQGLVAVIGDVTDKKRAEEALREGEERFRALMEQAPFSIQVFAPDGRTLRVNRAWEELWGVTLDQIGDYNILRDAQLEAKGILPLIRRAFAGEAVRTPPIEYNPNETIPDITRHADPRRWTSAVIYPLKDAAGRVREVVLVHEDITARKRAERLLLESEEKFRLLADTIPQLAWMARPDGHIFWYNRRWYEYTGTTAGQVGGWGWQCVHDPEVLPAVLERWRASLASGEPFDMVFPLRGADGRFRPFLTRVNPLRDGEGRILYWFGTSTDVGEIKAMEEALREADRLKDEFLAMLAHELRNPLAPIRNALHIMKQPGASGAVLERVRDMAERQVQHMARLLDDLLDVSRISRGRIELRKEVLNLAAVVHRSAEAVRPLFEERRHELTVSLPPSALRVEGDPTRLEQVLTNLLNNAAKYTDPGGRVWVDARQVGGEAVLRVRDTGIGIAPAMLPKIFDLFVQAERGLDRSQGGVGIGLTLVKKLVNLHGGQIEAHSAGPGQGSEFVVRLPVAADQGEAGAREGGGGETAPLPRRRVLVVDDNADAADSLALLLGLAGQDVRTAYDGPAALLQADTFQPDIVLLDIGMPGMDGYEVARRLRNERGLRGALLVALTGWGPGQDQRQSAEAGFDRHLVKPVDLEALKELLAGFEGAKRA